MTSFNTVCDNIMNYESFQVFSNVKIGILMIVLGIFYILMSFIILYFIRVQSKNAQTGDDKALQSTIFPVYVGVLWVNCFVNIYIGTITLSFDFEPLNNNNKKSVMAFATMWALQHLVVEGVAILLCQKGLGKNAAFRTAKYAIMWAFITLFVQLGIYLGQPAVSFTFNLVWNVALLIFYLVLWTAPQRNLYRRPAAFVYAKFWTFFRLTTILAIILYYIPYTKPAGNCFYYFGSLLPFALLEPIVLYYTLLQDSRWWQGLDISQGVRKAEAEEIRSPLQGVDINHQSALSLAASLDQLGVRPSRTFSKAKVRLLNFAYISLDKGRLLGAGSFSKVYYGKYRQRECAIKLIFTMDVTEDIISRIAAESQLLSSISHPNVVEILGVSVLPPSVCILLEYCSYGSLADVIANTGFNTLGSIPDFISHFIKGSPTIGKFSSRGLALSWTDRLFLAVGCARGLAALHSFSFDLCHRDVKSYNFLVDSQLNVKISDLELGVTDDLNIGKKFKIKEPKNNSIEKNTLKNTRNPGDLEVGSTVIRDSDGNFKRSIGSMSFTSNSDHSQNISIDSNIESNSGYAADEFLANWAAPEVIKTGIHYQSSDVYSLGLVLWEILSGTVPFSEFKRQDDIRSQVISGIRPTIPTSFYTGTTKPLFSKYIEIIERCWSDVGLSRPAAKLIAHDLEQLLKLRCYDTLTNTDSVDEVLPKLKESLISRPSFISMFNKNVSNKFSVTNIQITEILSKLQEEGVNINKFNSYEESWLIVLPTKELNILWVSKAWEEEFGLSNKELAGCSLKELDCFIRTKMSDKASKETNYDLFFQKIQEMKSNFEKHFLLDLFARRRIQVSQTGTQTFYDIEFTDSEKQSNQVEASFSIYAYPIPRKTIEETQSKSIPINIEYFQSNDASSNSNFNYSSSPFRTFSFTFANSLPNTSNSKGNKIQEILEKIHDDQSTVRESIENPSINDILEDLDEDLDDLNTKKEEEEKNQLENESLEDEDPVDETELRDKESMISTPRTTQSNLSTSEPKEKYLPIKSNSKKLDPEIALVAIMFSRLKDKQVNPEPTIISSTTNLLKRFVNSNTNSTQDINMLQSVV